MTFNLVTSSSSFSEDPKSKTGHSKTLRNLSKLMLDIADTRSTILRYETSILELQNRLIRDLSPIQDKFLTLRVETFRVLAGHLKDGWLKKRQANRLRDVLGEFADVLEDEFDVDLKVERLTLLGEIPLTEEEAMEEANLFAQFDSTLEEMFGSKFDGNKPYPGGHDQDRGQDRDQDQDPFQSNEYESRAHTSGSSQKKSMKHEAEEHAMAGDIRALYLLLARALHPDKEADEALKAEKTRWMQKVTAAYSSRNLAELLDILACNPMDSVGPYLSQAPLKTIQGFAKRLRRELNHLRKQAEWAFSEVPPQYQDMVGPDGINEAGLKRNLAFAQKRVPILKQRLERYRTRSAVEELLKLLGKYDWEELM
jgi:hypothetical protein